MNFAAPWSTATKVLTVVTLIVLAVVQGVMMLNEVEWEVSAVVLTLSILVVAISFLFAPSSYGIDGTHLYIRRPLLPIQIRFNDILEVRRLNDQEMEFTLRLFGSGGLFGFFGLFYSRKLGWQRWYATRTGDLVGIVTNTKGWLVLSPDSPEAFVAALKKRL